MVMPDSTRVDLGFIASAFLLPSSPIQDPVTSPLAVASTIIGTTLLAFRTSIGSGLLPVDVEGDVADLFGAGERPFSFRCTVRASASGSCLILQAMSPLVTGQDPIRL